MSGLETAVSVEKKGKKQYLLVKIGEMRYGFDISYVHNVIRIRQIVRVPKSQDYFKGIINLRGEIVAVMSLRVKMGFAEDVYSENTRIVILNFLGKGYLGIVVDEAIGMREQNEEDENVLLPDLNELISELEYNKTWRK